MCLALARTLACLDVAPFEVTSLYTRLARRVSEMWDAYEYYDISPNEVMMLEAINMCHLLPTCLRSNLILSPRVLLRTAWDSTLVFLTNLESIVIVTSCN